VYEFPQGVASGDPQPDAVTLWTRVVHKTEGVIPIKLSVVMSKDKDFSEIILSDTISASPEWDNTIRFYANGLQSHQIYFYQFIAGADTSMSRASVP